MAPDAVQVVARTRMSIGGSESVSVGWHDRLWAQLEEAWPLLNHYRAWNAGQKERAAFLDYLTNVPPRAPKKTS